MIKKSCHPENGVTGHYDYYNLLLEDYVIAILFEQAIN